jgi:hypothetical protein
MLCVLRVRRKKVEGLLATAQIRMFRMYALSFVCFAVRVGVVLQREKFRTISAVSPLAGSVS